MSDSPGVESRLPDTPPQQYNFAADLFQRNAARADKPAIIDDDSQLTYAELQQQSQRLAQALADNGVRREERVLLLMQDCVSWPVCFLGSLYAGVIPVAVNTLLTAQDYAYMLQHCRARLVFASASLLPVLKQALQHIDHQVQHIIYVGEDDIVSDNGDEHPGPLVQSLADWLALSTRQLEASATRADDMAFWLYSSGSTGRPKGTVHRQASLYWSAELYGRGVLALTENDVCFSAAKLFFAYGLGNSLSFPLYVGATVILMAGRPTPDAVFQRWRQHQPSVFFGAPTGYAGMLAAADLPAAAEVNLRLCSSAGEALPADLGERFSRHYGIDVYDGIGSTEMLHIYLSNAPDRLRYGTTGWPVAGYEIELRGEDGLPVETGKVGELFVRGPTAALMYWSDRDKSQRTFQGEWTRSGDQYVCNEDGSYTCIGRSDDMFKVSGMYVSPFEVEAALITHAAVLESAVVGLPDADGLIKSKAFVVLRPGVEVTAEELQAFVKSRLAPYKYPRQVEFVAELPKTATGKVMRFRLRD